LKRTNVKIVSSIIDAQVIIKLEVKNEKVVVGFSGAGRPRELELRTSVRLEITDQSERPIQPLDKLKIVRSVSFSDTDVLAAQSHEAFHREDIDKQLAIRIIERLQRINPVNYAN
jgi:LPS-assembly lipoprotein